MHFPKIGIWRRRIKRIKLLFQVRIQRPRIVLGSGGIGVPGWIMTDIDQLDILNEKDWAAYFRPAFVEAILAEHVWEHLTVDEGTRAAELCWKYLRPGGRLRVAVPDGLHPDRTYIDAVKPGGSGPGADDHKVLYSWRALQTVLEGAGFTTRVLEYFDESGDFHAVEWDPMEGMIRRSKRFDNRNRDGALHYTSIIVDAIRPIPGANSALLP